MPELIFDQKDRIGTWVAEQVEQTTSWGDFYAMGIVNGDEVLAGIVLNNFNGANATCHIAVAKVTKLLPRLFKEFCIYAFVYCKLKRLTGMVPLNEPKIIAFDKHLGFEEEFVMKDAAPEGDMQVLVMWPDRCPWLPKEQ